MTSEYDVDMLLAEEPKLVTSYIFDHIDFNLKHGEESFLGLYHKFNPNHDKPVSPVKITCEQGAPHCSYTLYATNDKELFDNGSYSRIGEWAKIVQGPQGVRFVEDISGSMSFKYWSVLNNSEGYTQWEDPDGTYYYPALRFTFDYSPMDESSVNDILEIDPQTRTVKVPSTELVFGVRNDSNVERKYFECSRFVGDSVDLSQADISINYVNATGYIGRVKCSEPVVITRDNRELVTFNWLIDSNVTAAAGNVSFTVCATFTDEKGSISKEWNLATANGIVLQGIEMNTMMNRGDTATIYLDYMINGTKIEKNRCEDIHLQFGKYGQRGSITLTLSGGRIYWDEEAGMYAATIRQEESINFPDEISYQVRFKIDGNIISTGISTKKIGETLGFEVM